MRRGSHIVKFEKVVGAKRTNDAHFIIIVGHPQAVENEKRKTKRIRVAARQHV